jgi:hypothetical protein
MQGRVQGRVQLKVLILLQMSPKLVLKNLDLGTPPSKVGPFLPMKTSRRGDKKENNMWTRRKWPY